MGLKISRRTFLKATGLAGAGVAMGGSLNLLSQSEPKAVKAQANSYDKVVMNWCHGCGGARTNCSILCYVKNGRWVHTEGNPDAGNNGLGLGNKSICIKANSMLHLIYNPNRLKYPMKRVGKKGEGKFKRITWDEGLQEVADKLLEQKEKYGARSYAVLSPQAYQVLWLHGRRFLNVHGSPNYLHSGICAIQRGCSRRVSTGVNVSPGDMNKTKLYVNWGANPENSGMNLGTPYKVVHAKEKGMKIIDIRPMLDPLAAKADVWVPVRPGTDLALALAILHVIIGENLYDHEFVSQWCHGFEELADHVKQFTPEWAAEKTGLPVEQIYKVARMMGTIKPMAGNAGNGIGDQAADGNWQMICIGLIFAITGNIDIPGGAGSAGLTSGPALSRVLTPDRLTERLPFTEEDKANGWVAGMSDSVAPELPPWYINTTTWETGPNSAYYRAVMSVITENPYPLKAIFGQHSTPFGATRQPKKIKEALEKLELYYVMDQYWNPSVPYADYVFPACSMYECSHEVVVKNVDEGSWLSISQKVAEPQGEAKSDWEFYPLLATKMGYGKDFWNGDVDEFLRERLKDSGYTLEELRAAPRGIFIERDTPHIPQEPAQTKRYEALFKALPHGKVQCYNEYIGGKPNNHAWGPGPKGTLKYLPEYKGPPEGIAETPELVKDYPLIITDVHADRRCNHSYFMNLPYTRERGAYPWCTINPATAKKYGIKNGDWMKIESIHGWCVLKAEYFEGISPECLMAKRGWWQSCPELGLPGYDVFDGGGDTTVLYNTDYKYFDDFHSAMPKQTLVKISKSSTPPLTFDDKPRYEE